MEVPQDYNTTDSFYHNKLLQSIGINNSQLQTTNEDSQNLIRTLMSGPQEHILDEEVLDLHNGRINEETLEESQEDLGRVLRQISQNKVKETKRAKYLTGNRKRQTQVRILIVRCEIGCEPLFNSS
jgi:hypothetical protein